MTTRCFAFGCSITNWPWATCADFIGVNFDEYYNFGKPGASNTFIMNRLVETDHIFKFNATDTVIIGMTGFGRLSFFNKNDWQTHGDILWGDRKHPEHIGIFNHRWALYNSYIAMKVIKDYLTFKGIIHYIYPAVDYKHWITDYNLFSLTKDDTLKALEIEKLLDIKEPLHESVKEERNQSKSYPIRFADGEIEMHPSPEEHFTYFCKQFPQFKTQKSENLLEFSKLNFDCSSRENQSYKFRNLFPHRRTTNSNLFIDR
jgi:hypothetical protein